MTRYWLITDTHWNHEHMVTGAGRPADYGEQIIKNWRHLVGPDDVVFHLGDVIFKRGSELKRILASLPGRKVLVKGNHDHERAAWYMRKGFDFVCYGFRYRKAYLTHEPVLTLPDGCEVNVHGHLHNTGHRHDEYVPRPFHRLLALENEDYAPVLFEDFLARGEAAHPLALGSIRTPSHL